MAKKLDTVTTAPELRNKEYDTPVNNASQVGVPYYPTLKRRKNRAADKPAPGKIGIPCTII